MMQVSYPTAVPAPIEFPARLPSWNWQFEQKRYESQDSRDLLKLNGLDDIGNIFQLADRCLHYHKGRAVTRVKLHRSNGGISEAFIKMNWGRRRLVPRMTDVRSGQAFQSHPLREWQGIQTLRALGLLVPERFALFQRGWFWFQEAVLIKRVPPEHSLDEILRNGIWDQLSNEDRHNLLEAVVLVMERIHQAGLGWRGTCTRHFYPERTAGGYWQCWLIDCEGVHPQASERARTRDYRKLQRGFAISGEPATLHLFDKLVEKAKTVHRHETARKIRAGFSLRLGPTLNPSG